MELNLVHIKASNCAKTSERVCDFSMLLQVKSSVVVIQSAVKNTAQLQSLGGQSAVQGDVFSQPHLL
jgi:hypothetical protein